MANTFGHEMHQRIQNLPEDSARDCLAYSIHQTQLTQSDRVAEAGKYSTTARVGQTFVTAGNLAALIALLKQAEGNDSQSRSVKGTIIASLALSSLLILLQLLLATVSPESTTAGDDGTVWWQALNAIQAGMRSLLRCQCACFGFVRRRGGGDDHADANHANHNDVESGSMLPSIQQHVQAQGSGKLFTAWQEDMNITITLLGGVVIILNTIASGIIVNNGGSGLVPPPTPS